MASTTFADIIEEFYNTAKFTTKFTTKCGDFTWRVSDCEELVGGYSQEMMGFVLGVILRIRLPTDAVLFQNSHYPKVIVPASVGEKV